MKKARSKEAIMDFIEEHGESAFPFQVFYKESAISTGMTVRDVFALGALSGLLSRPKLDPDLTYSDRAEFAYKQADAMIKERAK